MNLEQKLIKITGWLLGRPKVAGLFVFLFLLLLIGVFTNQRYDIVKESEHNEMNNVLNVVKQNIEQSLRNSYTSALTLALTISDTGEPKDFEAVAEKIIDSGSHFKAVQLVPNGIIKYIYPLKGNEGAVNSSIFGNSVEADLRIKLSIKNKKMYFLGPNVLKQGGVGIVGRLPLYRENKFWGFSAVVINLDTFLRDVGIYNAEDGKYSFQFSKINIIDNKEEFYLPGNRDFKGQSYVSAVFPDGNWKIYLVATNKNATLIQIFYPSFLGFLLAILCSLLVTQLLKKAEEKVTLESWIRMESLVNTIDGIVWEADPFSFRFTFISKKVEDILGYSQEEWLSSPSFWADHLHPDDKETAIDYCVQCTMKRQQHNFEYRMIAKNGSEVWLRDIVNVISENDEPILLRGIMIDIGENKEAQKALNNSFKLVNEQNKRLLNFSYIVSHNLRSHTSNIQAISNLIENADSEEERKDMIALMQTVSGSLNETLINLNKVVNIQTTIDVMREKLNLNQYINNILDVLNDQIVLKKAVVTNNIPQDIEVNYNPAYLESILLNFIFNAIRYSHSERPPHIKLDCYWEGEELVLQISDNGIGIDLDKHGHQLFGMYKTFNSNPDSKGVGLFISKNQIEAMGGKVTVVSELGVGTSFRIYFN
jgi:PAS domain S-box-containing protein